MPIPEITLGKFQNFSRFAVLCLCIVIATLAMTGCNIKAGDPYPVINDAERGSNDPWQRAKLNAVAFRAIGQEPGWLMEITTGEKIMLSLNYGQDNYLYPYPEPEVFQSENRTVFQLVPADQQPGGQVELRGESCIDTMSGETFEVMVIITLDSLLYQGCGRSL